MIARGGVTRGAIGTASENVLLRVIASGTMSVIVVAITPVSVIVTDPAGVSHHHRESESSGETSDYDYVKVKRKHRSRR